MPDPNYARLLALKDSNPQEFYKLMQRVNEKVRHPHPGQVQVLESQARFRVMNCGRRWGKTVLAAKIILSKARKQKQMLWWVAPTYKIVKRGYEEVLKQIPDGVLVNPPPPSSNFDAGRAIVLHFKNGTKMEFYSAERPEGMLGAAVDFAVLDEAAIMKGTIWNQVISPTLIDHKGGALMISTPRGRNWFYDVWARGQDPNDPEWQSWTFTTQDNPYLPEGEADNMAAGMPKMLADQEVYAKWLSAGSQVFLLEEKSIERVTVLDNGLIEDRPVKGGVFLGVDLARTNDWTVLYGEMERDRRNCYFERMQAIAWSEQRRRIRRAVARLLRAGAEYVTLMVDEGNAGSVIVEELQEQGFDAIGVNFTTHKANMVRLLSNDLEKHQAFVLEEGLTEFENYGMTVSEAGRFKYAAPEGQHDDVVSAKMLAHWGVVNEGFGDVQILTAGADPSNPSDEDDEEEWLDLLDEDPEVDSYDSGEAFEEAGLPNPHVLARPPSPEELLQRSDLWF